MRKMDDEREDKRVVYIFLLAPREACKIFTSLKYIYFFISNLSHYLFCLWLALLYLDIHIIVYFSSKYSIGIRVGDLSG